MKILYGVCGEGRDHASRSRIPIQYLEQQGHEVRIVAGGKAYRMLSEVFDNVLQIESPQGFYKGNQNISTSKAVIINGGVTVLSEALYLKKPIFFFLPIRHQFEQVFNVRCVENLGVGISQVRFSEDGLRDFLSNLDSFSKKLRNYDVGNHEDVLARIEQTIQNMCKQQT